MAPTAKDDGKKRVLSASKYARLQKFLGRVKTNQKAKQPDAAKDAGPRESPLPWMREAPPQGADRNSEERHVKFAPEAEVYRYPASHTAPPTPPRAPALKPLAPSPIAVDLQRAELEVAGRAVMGRGKGSAAVS